MEKPVSAREVPPDGVPRGEPVSLSAADRKLARRCLSLLGVLSSCTLLGVAASLYLAVHYPLLLIGMSPLGRHLILVAPTVHPLAFLAVAITRRMAFSVTCFYLGRALGPSALDWLEARAPRAGRFYRWLERLFQRASHIVVFLLPGPGVSAIAGSSGMRAPVYVPLVALGLLLRMILVLLLGEWLREPLVALLALIEEYWVPGTIVLVVAVGIYRWRWRGVRPLQEDSG